ncbi:MAG: GNAT family N-acetyltransferase [Desulfobacterales bacterium]|nr:GNAT family N-acetyltransferase [Desulfobacterales bacterium]
MYQTIGKYIIRDWKTEDAQSIATYANNKKIWINLRDAFPYPYSLQDAEAFLTRAVEAKPKTVFAIATQNEAIGSIGLMLGEDVHRFTAELGYWLAEPFWGKGIMTQAVKCMTAYAVENLKLNRVFAEPYTTNTASAMVLKKAGFMCEGILRSNVFKDGKILDQFLYSYVQNSTSEVSETSEVLNV